MCGIAGFVERDGGPSPSAEQRAALLQGMCDVIRHRGPDDEGFYLQDGVALGMRRLSIIDVSTGHQPITNEDGTIWVVFNGEIYNYRELRSALERLGHTFRTATDTETIVHAYEEWGDRAFTHLRGMFGIALWDARARRLLLVRDRAGIKPLFYAQSARRFVFGSEIKSILASGEVTPELAPEGLDHYLSFLYTPRTGSIFKGIQKLAPGHLLSWSRDRFEVRPYWTQPADETFKGSDEDAVQMLRSVLADAVSSHMVSDVPIGAFLSGGIDSGVVVGLMAEASTQPVRTFSIGFDEPEFDELEAARRTAEHFETDHHEFVVRPDALSILDQLIDHFDEPFADPSAIPTWYVSQLAASHVKVALSGDGGDELFGGYDRYLPHPRVESFDRWTGALGRHLAGAAWRLIPHGRRGRNFLRHVSQDPRGRFADSVAYFQPDEKTALFSPALGHSVDTSAAAAQLADRFDAFSGLDWRSQMMRVDFETYLPEDILTKVDRMSMAHSLEARVPLLDHSVVQFASSLPSHMKIRHGERKHMFKRAASTVLPAEALTRKKKGFAVPIGAWLRGRLREAFVDTLQSTRARQRGYFNTAYIDRLITEHISGTREHTLRLWQLLVFELWHQRYLDHDSTRQTSPARASIFRAEVPALP